MDKNILYGYFYPPLARLRRSCFACWGHPKPRQNALTLFCEHTLRCGFAQAKPAPAPSSRPLRSIRQTGQS